MSLAVAALLPDAHSSALIIPHKSPFEKGALQATPNISMIDFAWRVLPAGLSLNPLAQAVVVEVAMSLLRREDRTYALLQYVRTDVRMHIEGGNMGETRSRAPCLW
jgi:hypothetical protein